MGIFDKWKKKEQTSSPALPGPDRICSAVLENRKHILKRNANGANVIMDAGHAAKTLGGKAPLASCRDMEECMREALKLLGTDTIRDASDCLAVTAVLITMQYCCEETLAKHDYYFTANKLLTADTLIGVYFLMSCVALDRAAKLDRWNLEKHTKNLLQDGLVKLSVIIEAAGGLDTGKVGTDLTKDRFGRYSSVAGNRGVKAVTYVFHSLLIMDIVEGEFIKAKQAEKFNFGRFTDDDVLASELTALLHDLTEMSSCAVDCVIEQAQA